MRVLELESPTVAAVDLVPACGDLHVHVNGEERELEEALDGKKPQLFGWTKKARLYRTRLEFRVRVACRVNVLDERDKAPP